MADWSLDECLSLIEQVQHQMPKQTRDSMSYSKRLRLLDYDLIAVAGKTTEQCKEKVKGMMEKIRKFKTLSELFAQLKDEFTNTPSDAYAKYVCKRVRPKQPQIAYMGRHMKKLRAKNGPNVHQTQLMKMAMTHYHELPADRRQHEVEEYHRQLNEFKAKVEKECQEFLGPHGDVMEAVACNLFVNKKVEKKLAKFPDADKNFLVTKYRDKWTTLDEDKRQKYTDQAREMNKKTEMKRVAPKRSKSHVEQAQGVNTQTEKKPAGTPKPNKVVVSPSTRETASNEAGTSGSQTESKKQRANSRACFAKDYMAAGHSFAEAVAAWRLLSEEEHAKWRQKALQIAGQVKPPKKVTAWGLFVRKHVGAGNQFNTAGEAFRALSEKKKKKLTEQAKALSEEAKKAASLSNHAVAGSLTPKPSSPIEQPVDQRKRPATEPAIAKKLSKKPKQVQPSGTGALQNSSVAIESDDDDGGGLASVFKMRSPPSQKQQQTTSKRQNIGPAVAARASSSSSWSSSDD